MLDAGKRNTQISIYNVAQTITGGDRTPVLTLYGTKWAQVASVSPREQEVAKSFAATVTHTFTVLYDSGLNNKQIIEWSGNTASIDGIVAADPANPRSEQKIYATQTVNSQAPAIVDASTLPAGMAAGYDSYGNIVPMDPDAISGISGFSGISGASGFSGARGANGFPGTNGNVGPQGPTGASGFSGVSGFSGASGLSGFSGKSGFSGASGASGISGATGATGASGFSGISGFSGKSGFSGISGFSGSSGASGTSGATGATGASGFSGKSGFSGTSGFSGISGYSGTPGGISGYVQYSDGTKLAGSSGLTFDPATGEVSASSVDVFGGGIAARGTVAIPTAVPGLFMGWDGAKSTITSVQTTVKGLPLEIDGWPIKFTNNESGVQYAEFSTNGAFRLIPIASAPSSPSEGQTYYDSILNTMRTWDGTTWQNHW